MNTLGHTEANELPLSSLFTRRQIPVIQID